MTQEQLCLGFLAAWIVIWGWLRIQSRKIKPRDFKFWGDMPPNQKQENQLGLGVLALLILVNVLFYIF